MHDTVGAGAGNAKGCFIHSLPWGAHSLVGETDSSEAPEDKKELGLLKPESRKAWSVGAQFKAGPGPWELVIRRA